MINPLVCFAQDRSRETVIDCFYFVPYFMIGLFTLALIILIALELQEGTNHED